MFGFQGRHFTISFIVMYMNPNLKPLPSDGMHGYIVAAWGSQQAAKLLVIVLIRLGYNDKTEVLMGKFRKIFIVAQRDSFDMYFIKIVWK